MADTFTPPQRVQSAARRGLRLHDKTKSATPVGIARGRDLSNGRAVSLETIGRMVSFFARHGAQRPANVGTDAEPSPWLVAWLLWGGDPGKTWAESVWRRHGPDAARSDYEIRSDWHPEALRAEAGEVQEDGTVLGRWLRVACTGRLHSRATGKELRPLTRAELVQAAEHLNASGDRDPVVWNWSHQTKTTDPGLRGLMPLDVQMPWGRAVSARVEDDGGKSYLAVRTAWTPHGQAGVTAGAGALWPSVEFSDARFERDDGTPVEGVRLIGIAVTDSPAYAPGDVDPVVLRAEQPPLEGMDGAEPQGADMSEELMALMERLDALEARLGALEAAPDSDSPEDGEAEERGDKPLDEMRSEFAALRNAFVVAADKEQAKHDADAKALDELRAEVADLKAAKEQAEFRSDFAAALVAGKVEASEQDVYLQARSDQAAGRPAFFDAMFGSRAEGQFRSEQASVSTAKGAEPAAVGSAEWARSEFASRGWDYSPTAPDFANKITNLMNGGR